MVTTAIHTSSRMRSSSPFRSSCPAVMSSVRVLCSFDSLDLVGEHVALAIAALRRRPNRIAATTGERKKLVKAA